VKLLGRLLFLPVKLAGAAVEASFRAGRLVGSVPVRLGRRTSRVLGGRGTIGLILGVLLGLAFAPGPGREFRAGARKFLARVRQLRARSSADSVSDSDLAARVSFELEHAPRTWHLPQPTVTVDHGHITLRGHATDQAACDELARVAGGVPGVGTVQNLVVVDDDLEGDALVTTAPTEG
jgi:hypothetical protein